MSKQLNVLGTELQPCSLNPVTGFYRSGACETGPDDHGCHAVCTEVTEEFLAYSKSVGNDLSTPAEHYGFPGLKPGDRWCLCLSRWKEALDAGFAPPIHLKSTHEVALKLIPKSVLEEHGLD